MVDSPHFDGARILQPGFPGDTGAADPAVAAALGAHDGSPETFAAAVTAMAGSRLLVPVVAVLGEVEIDEDGLAHDKSSAMAAVLLTGADGRVALLAFTSTQALAAWDPQARPVPVTAEVAALSAVQEGADALVVDVAGPGVFVLEGQDLEAFAAGWSLARAGERYGWLRPES